MSWIAALSCFVSVLLRLPVVRASFCSHIDYSHTDGQLPLIPHCRLLACIDTQLYTVHRFHLSLVLDATTTLSAASRTLRPVASLLSERSYPRPRTRRRSFVESRRLVCACCRSSSIYSSSTRPGRG